MNSTDTTPAVGGRQVGQLLAGRFRLAMFKGGDDIADVWHALDESTAKVVTLEILRDRENEAARQRFLAEAHRMAAIERPSVMRVAAIHNEAADTFIVFEHLIPLPVVLTGLTPVAKDVRPATKAAEDKDKTVVMTPVAPQAPAPVAPATLAAVVGPKRSAAAPEPTAEDATVPTIVDLDEMPAPPARSLAEATVRIPETMQAASRSIQSARSDVSDVVAKAKRFVAHARLSFRDLRPDTLFAAARALLPRRFDMFVVTSLITRATARVRRFTSGAATARTKSARAA
ncbi:MAG: hypothetical protein ACRDF9_06255, partial [Candidatus Limnocylindria bacterium]